MNLYHLNPPVRFHMLAEIELDRAGDNLYYSTRFNDRGRRHYPELLVEAAKDGNATSLARELNQRGCFVHLERHHRQGRVHTVRVPSTAAQMFAEGEFNRFYIRGLCLHAIERRCAHVEVYRAKPVAEPRRESEMRIGDLLEPGEVLGDLRRHPGEKPWLGVPGGIGSGLSVRLRDTAAAAS